jgi:uncharacterized protein (TIGR02444 family)
MSLSPQSSPALAKGNPLWDFSTWAYAQPGVEKACLALQSRMGLDINMVMFCLWLAYRGSGTANLAQYLGSALKLSRDWQRSVVEPLRTCRNNLKDFLEDSGFAGTNLDTATALRDRVKHCEVDMEHLQVIAMYSLVHDGLDDGMQRPPAEQKEDAQNNLMVYFSATGVKLDPLGQTHVMRVLTAVFGG